MRQIEDRYISLLTDFGFKRIKMFNDKLSFKYVDIAKFTPTELKEYEDSLKAYRDVKNSIDTALEKGREEGRAEGREEGRAEGRAEGREEGRAEGRAEGRVEGVIQVARKLLDAGMDVDTIMKMTDLSKGEIEKLFFK